MHVPIPPFMLLFRFAALGACVSGVSLADTAQVAQLWPGSASVRERTVHVALQRLRCNSKAMAAIAPAPAASPLDNRRFRGQWEMFNSYDAALQRDKMVPFVDEAKSTTFKFRFTPTCAAGDVPIYIECNKQRFIALSVHFAALFSGGFSEGSASSVDSVVDVEGDPEAYADLKRYVHGAVFPLEAANLIHLFALADMYRMEDCCRSIHCRLLALCENDSCHALATVSNIPAESEGGLREIRDMALVRVAFAGAEALVSDAWLDVPADAAQSVLLQRLHATEVQILDAVLRWVRHRDSTVNSNATEFPAVGSKCKRFSTDAGEDTATAAGHSSPAGQSVDNEGRDAALAMLSCVSMAGIPLQRIRELVDLDWADKSDVCAILEAHFSPESPRSDRRFRLRLRQSSTRTRHVFDWELPKNSFYVSFHNVGAEREHTSTLRYASLPDSTTRNAVSSLLADNHWHENAALCKAANRDAYICEAAEVLFSSNNFRNCVFGVTLSTARPECSSTERFESTNFIVCSGGFLRSPKVQRPWVANADGSCNFDLQPSLKQESVMLYYGQSAEESPASLLYTASGAELAPFTMFSIVVMRQRGGGMPPHTYITVLVNGIELYSVRISCFAVSVMAAARLLPKAWDDGTSITSHGKLTWNQNASLHTAS